MLEEVNNAVRVAGNYTCKHIPWYRDWHLKLDPDEWENYRQNNISSSAVKMINAIGDNRYKQALDYYTAIDTIGKETGETNGLDEEIGEIKKILAAIVQEGVKN